VPDVHSNEERSHVFWKRAQYIDDHGTTSRPLAEPFHIFDARFALRSDNVGRHRRPTPNMIQKYLLVVVFAASMNASDVDLIVKKAIPFKKICP
jgi:hypothetical protein